MGYFYIFNASSQPELYSKVKQNIKNIKMALSTLLHIKQPYPFPPLHFSESQIHPKKPLILTSTPLFPTLKSHKKMIPHRPHAVSVQGVLSDAMNLIQSAHPTWKSALFSNLLIFVVGSPILVSGLSISGIFAAYLLGTLTWRAFGPSGFLLVASYFVIVSYKGKKKEIGSLLACILLFLLGFGDLFYWVF